MCMGTGYVVWKWGFNYGGSVLGMLVVKRAPRLFI